MPEEQDQKRKSGFWPVVVVLLFLFVAYVASYGPVVAAHNGASLTTQWWNVCRAEQRRPEKGQKAAGTEVMTSHIPVGAE